MLTRVSTGRAQETLQDRHAIVAIRMIGHQLLLHSGDSTSRVMPVEKEGDRYKLRFESEFEFEPEALVGLIDSMVRQSGIAESYLVEVQECENREVVYSYEVRIPEKSDIIPCSNRVQPKGCYQLMFTILQGAKPANPVHPAQAGLAGEDTSAPNLKNYMAVILPMVVLLGLTGWFFKQRKKKIPTDENPELISIGASRFDKRNMTFSVNHETIELTGKEADLLFLLHGAANSTIERETILHEVWGDDGDYAGRTLDVFISKLRKKIEADVSLKIVNIRGVGYKLIVNG